MTTLDIVTHVWAKRHEQYAWHLQLQLTSVFRFAPLESVKVFVCHAPDDELTVRILDFFSEKMPDNVQRYALPHGHLFRRAVGRNLAALATRADLVWFADVDYFWKQGAFDTLCALDPCHWRGLLMPAEVWRHRDWALGDALVDRIKQGGVGFSEIPDDGEFVATREKIAIGGMQIVPGDFCRAHGYLNGTRWIEPLDPPPRSFISFRDDIAFRRQEGLGRGHKITIPEVYRIRHTENGYGRENRVH